MKGENTREWKKTKRGKKKKKKERMTMEAQGRENKKQEGVEDETRHIGRGRPGVGFERRLAASAAAAAAVDATRCHCGAVVARK